MTTICGQNGTFFTVLGMNKIVVALVKEMNARERTELLAEVKKHRVLTWWWQLKKQATNNSTETLSSTEKMH